MRINELLGLLLRTTMTRLPVKSMAEKPAVNVTSTSSDAPSLELFGQKIVASTCEMSALLVLDASKNNSKNPIRVLCDICFILSPLLIVKYNKKIV
jgi:hypothetical protein